MIKRAMDFLVIAAMTVTVLFGCLLVLGVMLGATFLLSLVMLQYVIGWFGALA